MSIRVRDRVGRDTEAEARAPGLAATLCMPDNDTELEPLARGIIDLTLLGMRWMAFGNFVSVGLIAYLIVSAGNGGASATSLTLLVCGAVILVCDGLTLFAPMKKLMRRISAGASVALLTGLNFLTAGAWAYGLTVASGDSWQTIVIAAGALGFGKLATMAMPTAFAARILVAAGIYMVDAFDPATAIATVFVTLLSLALVMSLARSRWRILGEKTEAVADAKISGDLIDAFERSGRGWFWGTDSDGRLSFVSDHFAGRLGATREKLIGIPLSALFVSEGKGAFSDVQAERTVGFTLNAGLEFNDLVVRSASDDECWWSLSGSPTLDAQGRCTGFLGSGTDLTAQRQSEAHAAKLALYDGLTGLPNRMLMRQTLEELLKDAATRAPDCGLLLLDLDRFKNVNDTLGHPMGDALLKIVAQRLSRIVGEKGQVGRLGGDEFKVVIPEGMGRVELAELADAIIARLSLPYVIDDCTIQIGASLGIAVAPTDGIDPDELTRNADLALYAAKAAGKGVHRFYQPAMHAEADDRRAIENDLREVLNGQELSLVYQPVVEAKSERVIGFEALVRWNHPKRGAIPPSLFIPIAEEIGLIGRIGDWIIRQACSDASAWPEQLRLAINLSPLQLSSPTLMTTLMSALADSGLAPGRLELEITEGVFLNEDTTTEKMLDSITAMGIRLVLDDFGTGYASLGYLKRVPFSKIKIDQSFVRGAASDHSRNNAIICAIVGLAESLGMETVAEGAETLDEIEFIRSLGCSQIQGYIFGQPMSAEAATARALASVDRPDDGAGPDEREPRLALLRFATLKTDGHIYSVKIRNISAHGALIEVKGDEVIGTAVEIELSDGWKFDGEVRWRRDSRFGVRFASAIDVDKFVQSSTARVSRIAVADLEKLRPGEGERRAAKR